MTPQEIRPLVVTAKRAYEFQKDLGNIEPGTTFDTWRHNQVMAAVGREGFRQCVHADFRPLSAHFLLLAGDSPEAFRQLMRSGKVKGKSPVADNHETRDQLIHNIRAELAGWNSDFPAKEIHDGYVFYIARSKTGMDNIHDWETMRRRCDVGQLTQVISTLRNRLAAKRAKMEREMA